MVDDADLSNEYLDQSWYDFYLGTNFHQEDRHTYACEWDTAVIRTYLGFSMRNTIWKYYRTIFLNFKVGSGCMASGQYKITYGFPYNNFSESQIRLTSGVMDDSVPPQPGAPSTELGQMEINYVKAWQRADQVMASINNDGGSEHLKSVSSLHQEAAKRSSPGWNAAPRIAAGEGD